MSDKVGLLFDVERLQRERDEARETAQFLMAIAERTMAWEVTIPHSPAQADETVERIRHLAALRETMKGWEEQP